MLYPELRRSANQVTVVDIGKGIKEVRPTVNGKKPKQRPIQWNESVTKHVHDGWVEQVIVQHLINRRILFLGFCRWLT